MQEDDDDGDGNGDTDDEGVGDQGDGYFEGDNNGGMVLDNLRYPSLNSFGQNQISNLDQLQNMRYPSLPGMNQNQNQQRIV